MEGIMKTWKLLLALYVIACVFRPELFWVPFALIAVTVADPGWFFR